MFHPGFYPRLRRIARIAALAARRAPLTAVSLHLISKAGQDHSEDAGKDHPCGIWQFCYLCKWFFHGRLTTGELFMP
jgi:hypothetical protein